MANFYTDLTDSTNTHQNAHQRDDARIVTGQLCVATASYTMTTGTDETASDFIYIVKLPSNVVVMPWLCHVLHDDMGDALTFDVGDASDPNRYASGVACGTNAGIKPFIAEAATALPAAALTPYVIPEPASGADDNRMIIADLTTVTSPTASQEIIFNIVYRVLR